MHRQRGLAALQATTVWGSADGLARMCPSLQLHSRDRTITDCWVKKGRLELVTRVGFLRLLDLITNVAVMRLGQSGWQFPLD